MIQSKTKNQNLLVGISFDATMQQMTNIFNYIIFITVRHFLQAFVIFVIHTAKCDDYLSTAKCYKTKKLFAVDNFEALSP